MKPNSSLRLEPRHTIVIDAARNALDKARSSVKETAAQRTLNGLHFSYQRCIELIFMSAMPCAALLWFKPLLIQFWFATIFWWSKRLDLPLALTTVKAVESLQWQSAYSGSFVPTAFNGAVTSFLVITVYTGTFWLSDRQTPLKYIVRALCLVQASALLFFMFSPSMFSYTMEGHLTSMLDAGYYLMLAIPVLLALGWGVLRLPTYQKLLYPMLMLIYFAVMLPHKVLLHALILQYCSVLFMPILYLCFGTVFDLMVFVALYSWLASMAPANALR